MGEVRCKKCGRLLGVVRRGLFENKYGKQIIRAERAEVTCPRCEEINKVFGDKKEDNRIF